MRNNFAKPSSLKAKSNQNPQFGMTAKTPTEKEKQTAARLENHGSQVIADKIKNVWKIICHCGHQILGRSGGDLNDISDQADGHKH